MTLKSAAVSDVPPPSPTPTDQQQNIVSTCNFIDHVHDVPADVWYKIVDFLELRDLPSLLSLNRDFLQLLENETVFAQFARQKFPVATLDLAPYHGSWKQLLQDDNAENGLYLRQMFVLSEWNHNREFFHLHYMNAIRCMIWDRKSRQVYIGIEAFGHEDLRQAAATTIFQVRPRGRRPVRFSGQHFPFRQHLGELPSSNSEERKLEAEHAIQVAPPVRFPCHDLCLLAFNEEWFKEPDCHYKFTYNGSPTTSGSDYECKMFLHSTKTSSPLREYFQLGYSGSVVGSNHCEFVSRDTSLLVPSNVMDWPKMATGLETEDTDSEEMRAIVDRLFPPGIRELHSAGVWGVVARNTATVQLMSDRGEH